MLISPDRPLATPPPFPLTREGEVALARQFETGEILIMEGLLAAGVDPREVLLDPTSRSGAGQRPFAADLTPHRLEIATRYVETLERANTTGLSWRRRRRCIRPLAQHRRLTRVMLEALRQQRHTPDGPRGRTDPRIRIGLAMSDGAREELLRSNLGIVAHIARRYPGYGVPLSDLMQEGYIGLLRAVEKFDLRRGHRFVAYAAWWIRATIARALEGLANEIRVPYQVVELSRHINAARERLARARDHAPGHAALARHLDLPESTVARTIDLVKQPLSLELPRGDGEGETLAGTLADTESPLPDDAAADAELTRQLLRLLDTLAPREQEMIRLRYGIGKKRGYTLQEVGDRYGLSRERVRQIERAALDKLRRDLDSGLAPERSAG